MKKAAALASTAVTTSALQTVRPLGASSWPSAAAALGQLEAPSGLTVWSALIVTAVLASAAAFFIQSYAQQHTSPDRTALILASEPAFAGFFGWLLADDRLTALSLLGAGLIVAAIVAVDLVPRLRPPRPLPEA